jgi:hypothetical protein
VPVLCLALPRLSRGLCGLLISLTFQPSAAHAFRPLSVQGEAGPHAAGILAVYFSPFFGNNAGIVITAVRQIDDTVLADIKFNCDVSDARYWGHFSICGLLMRYRDLFRSEQGLPPWAEFGRSEITEWIGRKEARWPVLENRDFRDIMIDDLPYHPFDVFEINRALTPKGFVYGAGYGMYLKPTFFLARLAAVREVTDHTVYVAGREVVRDLFTAPAMLQGRCIFLRRDPLKTLLWEKLSELTSGRASALEHAFLQFGLRPGQAVDQAVEKKLDAMAAIYCDVLLRHELAESMEDVPEWSDIVSLAGDRNAEHYVRAIKDLIADTSDFGPFRMIVAERDRTALSLFIGLTEGHRKVLFPEIGAAYREFLGTGNWEALERTRKAGYARFHTKREAVLHLYNAGPDKGAFTERLRKSMQGSGG